ncbi:DUF1540 domain-containing protein [Gulosibacter chungangensis]|uniref:DUF1540 domain-containing protein n=1 Tax=Gulosibacter chungangensis TaxID=979746 RepID=A0A7J5BDU3_9MICO|nr:DUF1540 domain-containing protein [Gulosibacter chungangensis]KAB1644222.1 DUF1540 domain-containing protein [Gulosibacter chungangensis]
MNDNLTRITSCTATACSFNHDSGCSAPAITMGRREDTASCTTFVALDADGGLPVVGGHVAACQMTECVHNRNLMCTSNAITVNGSTAQCSMFEVASAAAA